jgi:hypothetical protein
MQTCCQKTCTTIIIIIIKVASASSKEFKSVENQALDILKGWINTLKRLSYLFLISFKVIDYYKAKIVLMHCGVYVIYKAN